MRAEFRGRGDYAAVRGAEQLVELGEALKRAPKELKLQLQREIREAGKPIVSDIKAGVLATFPNRGGMANLAARSTIGVRTRLTGRSAGVRIMATGRRGRGLVGRTLRSTNDAGYWRHPAYARIDQTRKEWTWVGQSDSRVKGWFEEPIIDARDDVRRGVLKAMERTAERIARSV